MRTTVRILVKVTYHPTEASSLFGYGCQHYFLASVADFASFCVYNVQNITLSSIIITINYCSHA